jgi:hypothetical protein
VATKDLSRTVIEGGRYYSNCFMRRASHGGERASTRDWLSLVEDDLEYAESSVAPPIRRIPKSFRDKLGPAKRWLASQVGRPWAKVYSELCTRFDTRTLAGRHVVHDHMLPWVRLHGDPLARYSRFDLYVDAHGILRKPALFGRAYRKLAEQAVAWAAGRVCAETFRGWWWFRANVSGEPCALPYKCDRQHYAQGWRHYHAKSYVGLAPLTRGERRYLGRIPAEMTRSFVIASPWPSR